MDEYIRLLTHGKGLRRFNVNLKRVQQFLFFLKCHFLVESRYKQQLLILSSSFLSQSPLYFPPSSSPSLFPSVLNFRGNIYYSEH